MSSCFRLYAIEFIIHIVTESLFACAASIEQRSMGILVQYSSLPGSDRDSPRIGAFNTVLDDADGALTRCDAALTL